MRRVGNDARGGRVESPYRARPAPAHSRRAAAALILACLAWALALAPAARAIPAGYVAVAGYDQYGELGDG